MTERFCNTAIACVLIACALTIIPLIAGANPAFNASHSALPTRTSASPMTPIPGKVRSSVVGSMFEMAQSGYGNVCRNGSYACRGEGTGWIGYSCCGCGFCGWWSAN
jgi:hypothetical protein